ncbi:Tn7-like transposition protein D [Paenibacillus sophorae]|uniref:Tn7-like transposition protein D n=1 Tax=Paenibacillus sophorae TaxID=1333845 RepID=A0A1H8VY69_9BACL|nr:TnsD family Tn7-like transposition protein [Paenibacillus sophorae]SEP19868.1 Tn7-like transposition protein D [Paenibacillus sophorae]
MVAHFPSLYPDELLYSGIARYHQMSGNTSQKQTVKELFGDRLVCATVDLPSHLRYLSERLGSVFKVNDLIMKHTLYPYYRAFIPQVKARKIYELMSEGASQGEVHALLGIPASLIKLPSYLKYCRVCYEEDFSTYYEPYWHRSHQVPGVCICPIHKEALIESTVSYTTREKKFEFTSLVSLEKDTAINLCVQPDFLNQYAMVAERSYELLQSVNLDTIYSSISKTDLHEKEYLTGLGRIRFLKLIQDFNAYYSQEFLKHLQCAVDDQCETWLHKMIRGNDLIFHPLRHILLADFMGKNLILGSTTGIEEMEMNQGKWQENNRHERTSARRSRTPFHDWKKRDMVTLTEVREVTKRIKSQKLKPQRISLATVSKNLNKTKVPFVLEKCLHKLPKTKRFLEKEIETTEQFQIRRLELAAARIAKEETKIEGWRLLKAAGLNSPLRESVVEKFKNLILY